MRRRERFRGWIGRAALVLIALCQPPGALQAEGDGLRFEDLGVASRVSESRGAVATVDGAGRRIVLVLAMDRLENALRTSLLVIDVETGLAEQYWFPSDQSANGPAYSLLLASDGHLYTTFGAYFVAFDVTARRWNYTGAAGEAMSFAEAPDGTIYFATYPTTSLYSYRPAARTLSYHGRLDLTEQYPNSLAVGPDGWVYAGIGTARSNLVAFNPATGERRQLVPDTQRRVGTGAVWQSVDGTLYGWPYDNGPVYRLEGGNAEPSPSAPPADGAGALRWGAVRHAFGDGSRLVGFDLPRRTLQIADAAGNVGTVRFDYQSEGTEITALVAGPDGKIYGSTSHPMHFWVYDPDSGQLTDLGPIERVGGGNFAGMAVQDRFVFGGAYAGGYLYAFDTAAPFAPEPATPGNPRLIGEFSAAVTRPRAVLAHPDGIHVLMGGFAGYGLVGGGLVIVDRVTGTSEVLPNERLAPGHSIVTMRALPNGDIVAGTSVEAPGGGTPAASVARLLIIDWPTRQVVFATEPVPSRSVFGTATVPGAREILSLEVDDKGMVYGLTGDGQFFVFDPEARRVVHRSNLGVYGVPVRADQAFIRTDAGAIYALLTQGIVRIDPETYAYERVGVPPVRPTAGIAYLDGVLYFASSSRLWRVRL